LAPHISCRTPASSDGPDPTRTACDEPALTQARAPRQASVDDLRGKLVEAMEARIKKLEDDRDRVLKQRECLWVCVF
jgi:hypothetical protein